MVRAAATAAPANPTASSDTAEAVTHLTVRPYAARLAESVVQEKTLSSIDKEDAGAVAALIVIATVVAKPVWNLIRRLGNMCRWG